MALDPAQLQDLLARTALKDRAAFTRLYEQTAPHLLAVALRIVRRRDRAEDVLQDAFINVWHHADSYAASLAAPMTWLTSITRNKALDLLRHVKTADHANLDDSDDAINNTTDDKTEPSRLLDAGLAQMHVQQCMASMSAPQRQALRNYGGDPSKPLSGSTSTDNRSASAGPNAISPVSRS